VKPGVVKNYKLTLTYLTSETAVLSEPVARICSQFSKKQGLSPYFRYKYLTKNKRSELLRTRTAFCLRMLVPERAGYLSQPSRNSIWNI